MHQLLKLEDKSLQEDLHKAKIRESCLKNQNMGAEEKRRKRNEKRKRKRAEKRKSSDMRCCTTANIEVTDRSRCVLCWNTSDTPVASRPNVRTVFNLCKSCGKHYCLTEKKQCMLRIHEDTPEGKDLRETVATKTRAAKSKKL